MSTPIRADKFHTKDKTAHAEKNFKTKKSVSENFSETKKGF